MLEIWDFRIEEDFREESTFNEQHFTLSEKMQWK
jgi:hypothetical protein